VASVIGVALKDLDGDGASLLVAEQTIDNLRAIRTVVTAVAALREFAVFAFEIT